MDRRRRIRIASALLAVASLATVGCHGRSAAPAARGDAGLATVTLARESLPRERRLDGVIEAVNQGTVAAQTAGRVEAIYFDVNDFVPAGAVILRLRATEQRAGLAQAEAALREAGAREAEAQTRYRRMADMFERKVVAKAMFDEAGTARDTAVAQLAAARAGLERAREGVAYTEVRAPYAGIVTRRLVQVGETVAPGTPLVSGLSLQYLRVVVDVPQSVVEAVRGIRKAAIYVGERRVEASKITIFPEAATPSNTFRARLELPANATDLYPGMFVKVGFVTGTEDALLVPTAALVERAEVTGVYVVAEDGGVALRQLRVGRRIGDGPDARVIVLAGLDAGEKVALDPVAASKAAGP